MDFRGIWRTKDGTEADIVFLTLGGKAWLGFINICGKKVITLWNKHGIHYSDSKLDLKERIPELLLQGRQREKIIKDLVETESDPGFPEGL